MRIFRKCFSGFGEFICLARTILTVGFLTAIQVTEATAADGQVPFYGFVYAEEIVPDLQVDLRYSGTHNFTGVVVDGYRAPRLIMSQACAESLVPVQEELLALGLSLKIFDAYRPQEAVNHFARWAADLNETATKPQYYPHVDKDRLFEDGYIAERSGHSRGSSVDLTIVNASFPHQELDMGTPFDFFDPISGEETNGLTPQQKANRLLLRSLMVKNGFKPYKHEWWHFTLVNEPFPNTYFNFPVE